MSLSNNFPAIKPSLNLDFANVKALDPRITFTRTTTATYYDGVTTAKAEENLLLQSQDFTTTWSQTRVIRTANADTAPDGTVTADSVNQESGQTTAGTVSQSANVIVGDYVISVFAKPNGRNFLIIRETLLDGTTNNTWFDVQNGTVGTTDAGHTATITASTNSYYRCSIKFTTNAARSGSINFYIADTDNSFTVADDGNGLYFWGAQLEQRSAVSSYTPTTTQPITNYIPALQTAASGVARFDHNPTTGESLGLLVEEQRTNICLQSEDFSTTWANGNSSEETNVIVSPAGTLTGDKLVEDTSLNAHFISQSPVTIAANTNHTFSCYIKAAERTKAVLRFAKNGTPFTNNNVTFDLVAGTATQGASGFATTNTPTITPVGNGWYRCSMGGIIDASSTDGSIQIRLVDASNNTTYTGDGYSGIFLWGAQLEAGAFPTSYIATTSASVTRNADAASMTGTNFSSWYRADEGALYGEASPLIAPLTTPGRALFQLKNTANTSYIDVRYRPSQKTGAAVVLNSGTQADTSSSASYTTASGKQAMAYATNDVASTFNGESTQTDSSVTIPTDLTKALIGNDASTYFNGTIKKLAFYPARLTNAQLQALTS